MLNQLQRKYLDWFYKKSEKIVFDNSSTGMHSDALNMGAAVSRCEEGEFVMFICPPAMGRQCSKDHQEFFPDQQAFSFGLSLDDFFEKLQNPSSHMITNIQKLRTFFSKGYILSSKFKVLVLLHHIDVDREYGFDWRPDPSLTMLEKIMPYFEKGVIVSSDTIGVQRSPEISEYFMDIMGVKGGWFYAVNNLMNHNLNPFILNLRRDAVAG